jgi:hypothetical protein
MSPFAFVRGGTDPLAAIPPSGGDSSETGEPTRDPGLYRHEWDGTYERLRSKLS